MAEEVIPVRDELAWDRLEVHLRSVLDLPDAEMVVQQFAGGRANLTYLLTFGSARLVLRRPPRGTVAPGAHDMAREHRVLSRLGLVYERAPLAHHFSDDTTIIDAPFVVLDFREGEVIRDAIPPSMAKHPDVVRRVDLAVIDAAADLHALDPGAAGLGDIGRPDGFGERQVTGWNDRWRRAAPASGLPAMERAAEQLAASVPAPTRPSIVHNDLKLDNCQFDATDPDRVRSVFDWDMATVGDPLFDLGSLLVSMGSSPLWTLSADEAVGRYTARSGIDVAAIDWYLAFATWRTAIVLQQLHNRYAAGDSTDDRQASYGDAVATYASRACELL